MGSHFSNDQRPSNMPGYQGRRFKQPGQSQSGQAQPMRGVQPMRQAPGASSANSYAASAQNQRASQPGTAYQGAYKTSGAYGQQAPRGPQMPPQKKKRWPIVVGVISVILLVILGAGGFAGYTLLNEVKAVKDDAFAIVDSASAVKDSLKGGDGTALMTVAEDMQERSGRMHETTSGMLWNLAAMVPVYGEDVKTVQKVAASLDTLSSDVVMPLASSMQGASLSSLFGDDGAINVELLSNLATTLVDSKEPINAVAEDIAALPDAHIEQLQGALEKAKPLVATVNDAVNVASEIAPYLPQMLGAGGQTRNYVIVAQNNSELRATGGFPGSTGMLSITDGKIELGDFSGISKLGGGEGTLPALEREHAMFGTEYTKIPQILTTNPDWSATGMHVRDLWTDRMGTVADGAIALDPVFLQHLLGLTGGVTLSDGVTIDGNNAAYILLHDVYMNKPVEIQDAYFAEAAGAAAKQIMGNIGNADISSLIETVKTDAKNGRFMVWMANEDEQRVVTDLGFGGEVSEDPTDPVVGVYIDDNTWSKMSWYLSVNSEISEAVENADGTKSYAVTVRFRNNITAEEAERAPKYITGYNPDKTSTGSMIFGANFYAPAGGSITDLSVSTGEPYAESSYGSLQTFRYVQQIQLQPQQESVVTFNVTTPAEAESGLRVRTTPTAQEVAGW